MYDPCVRCPCVLHQEVCRKFCTVYKAAVEADATRGYIDSVNRFHAKIIRKGR